MNKLKLLIDGCKSSVHLTVNNHRDYYETAETALENFLLSSPDLEEDVDDLVWDKMIETNTIIDIQFYPNSPVGFYRVLHYDLDSALDEALECL